MSKHKETVDIVNAVIRDGGDSIEFDRWLRRVKAEVWEEGWSAGYNDGEADADETFAPGPSTSNPYRR